MQEPEEETQAGFLIKNLLRGLLFFAVIITAFILLEEYIKENFESHIDDIRRNPLLLFGIFTVSEIVFGMLPPELFMMVWILDHIHLPGYVLNLAILTVISYAAGMLGYWIGKTFSKTQFYQTHLREKYLKQYEKQLKKFGGYLVFVGAVTPIPFSAMCMMAGSVSMNLRSFLLICITRVLRFALYGWMVWSFPNWFNG
jgi:membrane protein YqaA with SNARE-associated domain